MHIRLDFQKQKVIVLCVPRLARTPLLAGKEPRLPSCARAAASAAPHAACAAALGAPDLARCRRCISSHRRCAYASASSGAGPGSGPGPEPHPPPKLRTGNRALCCSSQGSGPKPQHRQSCLQETGPFAEVLRGLLPRAALPLAWIVLPPHGDTLPRGSRAGNANVPRPAPSMGTGRQGSS